jgi:hypothetical protein
MLVADVLEPQLRTVQTNAGGAEVGEQRLHDRPLVEGLDRKQEEDERNEDQQDDFDSREHGGSRFATEARAHQTLGECGALRVLLLALIGLAELLQHSVEKLAEVTKAGLVFRSDAAFGAEGSDHACSQVAATTRHVHDSRDPEHRQEARDEGESRNVENGVGIGWIHHVDLRP